MSKEKKTKLRTRDTVGLKASLVSIGIGLLLGLILLFCFNAPHAIEGFFNLILSGISDSGKIAKVFYQAAPLVFTGLSVAFAVSTQ